MAASNRAIAMTNLRRCLSRYTASTQVVVVPRVGVDCSIFIPVVVLLTTKMMRFTIARNGPRERGSSTSGPYKLKRLAFAQFVTGQIAQAFVGGVFVGLAECGVVEDLLD